MSEQLFLDMLVGKPVVLDGTEDGKLRVRFKATQSNVVNDNLRLYPDPVMDAAIKVSNTLVAEGRMVGESPHPNHYPGKTGIVFDTKIENSVIKIFNQFKDNGTVYVDAEVLETAKGKDLRALIDAGIPVGISMRALGDSVKKQIGGVVVDVATKLDIQSYDVVLNPATPGCEVIQILTDSQIAEVMADGPKLSSNASCCPGCSNQMMLCDPDNDGDCDFYYCQTCNCCFVPEMSQSSTLSTYTNQSLRRVDDSSWEDYDAARKFLKGKGMTDALEPKSKGDEDEVNIADILKAMKDSPEFQAMVEDAAEAKAKTIAQPALDAVQAQTAAAEAAQSLETAKSEAKEFVDGRLAELKGKVADEVLSVIADQVKDAADKTTAQAVIDGVVSVYSKASAQLKLDGLGFNGSSGEGGHVRVEVTNEPKPWAQPVKQILDSFDRYGETFGHTPDASIRKVNEKVVADLINRFETVVGYEAMKDSAAMLDSMVATDSVSVTTSQLLNQPTIQQALIIQAFQDVESLQFLAAETFEGSEVRWPVETFTSAGTINPASGQSDILVGEGVGIPESSINLAWLTFNPSWRRNAISVTTDVERQLKTGPARYDAISRGIYHIAFDKRRKLDNLAYLEMVMASDEYAPNVIASEVATSNVTAVSNGTNVAYKYNVTLKGAASATAGTNPIVRPRTKTQILPSGQTQTVTANPVSVTVGGSTLVQGSLDGNNNVVGTGATYAIDYENGIVYFTSGAGLNPAAATPIVPTLNYSAVTNYDRWSYTVPNGTKVEDYYNGLLQLVTKEVQLMGSAPRYNKPNLGIMSLNASQYIENASMWYRLNSPDLGGLTGGGTSTEFGHRSGVKLNRINAPWIAGDNRILLTQKGATRYAIETPYQIEGPYPKFDANQNIVDAKLFYGRENSVMATPQTIDTNGNIINPKSRSIKLVP